MSQAARQSIDAEPMDPMEDTAANAEADEPADGDDDENVLTLAIARAVEGIRRHPFPAVGGAFAIGFILGNGIPKFVGRTAVTIGLRALLRRVLADTDIVDAI